MARLSLIMNGERINTIDDLRKNFDPNQMLAFYKSKRLHLWLQEQSLATELKAVSDVVNQSDDEALLAMLMKAFNLDDEQINAIKKKMLAEKTTANSDGIVTEVPNDNETDNSREQNRVETESKNVEPCIATVSFQKKDGKVEASFSPVASESDNCFPLFNTDGTIDYNGLFFYNGYFYMWIYENPQDVSWKGSKITFRSSDFKTWERDEQLSKFNFEWDQTFITNHHCFLVRNSYPPSKSKCIIGSLDGQWKCVDFNFDQEMMSSNYRIIGIVEHNGDVGILTEANYEVKVKMLFREQRYQYKLFVMNDTNILSCIDLGSTHDECSRHYSFFTFSDHCFLGKSGNSLNLLMVTGGSNWNYQNAQGSLSTFSISNELWRKYKTEFVFPEIVYIYANEPTSNNIFSHEILCYSKNGEDWERCPLASLGLQSIVLVSDVYYAVINDQQGNTQILSSQNGIKWDIWKTIIGKHEIKSILAGNRKIIIAFRTLRSLGYHYLVCNVDA